MTLLDIIGQDLRYAARGLRNNKGLTIAIIVTLTLGLGVNAAVFSMLDRLFVRPPAGVAAPGSVRRVYLGQIGERREFTFTDRFNYPQWLDLRNAASSTMTTTYALDSLPLGDTPLGSRARRVVTAYIDAAYWALLGVHLERGRAFTAEEAAIESPANLAIISDAFWRRELGTTPDVIGQQVRLGSLAYTVIGVAPRGFTGTDLDATQLWLPLGAMPMPGASGARRWYQIRGVRLLHVLARPEAGIRAAALEDRLTSAFRIGSIANGYRRDSAAVVSTGSIISAVGPLKKQQEITLAARLPWISILVLLIASANVANLLLARAMRRRREVAVRLALGISRRRLAGQLFVESGLLALLAALAAVLVGTWTGALLRQALMPHIHWDEELIDWRLALLTGCTALIAALATGLAPLVHAWRLDLTTLLKRGSRRGARSAGRLHGALVITQTALAVTLLCGAGLSIESLRHVLGVDLGYDVEQLAIAEPRLVDARGGEDEIPREERAAGLAAAARRLRTTDRAGIQDVALVAMGPMRGVMLTDTRIPGLDSTPMLAGQEPVVNIVSPEYANVVGLHMARGRFFDAHDREGAPPVAVVNETMARTVWPGQNAVGQCVKVYGIERPCYTIVGIAHNTRQEKVIESPTMQYYVPLAQGTVAGGTGSPRALVIRYVAGQTDVAMASVARVFRDVLPSVDASVHPMHALLAEQFRPWQLGASLLAALGVLALVVALFGLYGVISQNVTRRTHEMGVRMALGAPPARVMALVIRGGIETTAIGVVLGLALTLAGGRLLSALLYGTSPYDPAVLGGAAILMLITALLSCGAPAVRAARAEPAAVFRTE